MKWCLRGTAGAFVLAAIGCFVCDYVFMCLAFLLAASLCQGVVVSIGISELAESERRMRNH